MVTLTVGKQPNFKKLTELQQKLKVDFTGKELVKKEIEEFEVLVLHVKQTYNPYMT